MELHAKCRLHICNPYMNKGSIDTSRQPLQASGSGIGCLFDPRIRDPGWEKVSIRIRDEQPGSYFLELRNHFFAFFGVKILKFFDEDPGSGMETVRIRDGKKSDPGYGINIPDPPHCLQEFNGLQKPLLQAAGKYGNG
jgi:hypothetical protein